MLVNDILNFEIRLLVVKYGYKRVIESLAANRNTIPENLEELIRKIELGKVEKPKPKQINIEEIVSTISKANPEKASKIQQLGIRFENKNFLPQLKDVRKFLEKRGTKPVSLKNRMAGAKRVFDIISELPDNVLDELIDSRNDNGSDFSILADQIIGTRRND